MVTTATKSLSDHIRDVIDTKTSVNINIIADEVISRLSEHEMAEYFKEFLTSRVSQELSSRSPLVTNGTTALTTAPTSMAASPSSPTPVSVPAPPKRAGKPWSIGWAGTMVSSGQNGLWVRWPEFTIDMAAACRERLEKRVETSQENIRKYKLIEAVLTAHGVSMIADLEPASRDKLEKDLGEVPTV